MPKKLSPFLKDFKTYYNLHVSQKELEKYFAKFEVSYYL